MLRRLSTALAGSAAATITWSVAARAEISERERSGPADRAPRPVGAAELRSHNSADSLWVSYRGNVYDVTDFVDEHPGGAKSLIEAAGGAVDFFVAYWAVHEESEKFRGALRGRLVGPLLRHWGRRGMFRTRLRTTVWLLVQSQIILPRTSTGRC